METKKVDATTTQTTPDQQQNRRKWLIIGSIAGGIILVGALSGAVYGLTRNEAITANIRDIFIIFLALESLIIGGALVILIVQLAGLVNLIQNELKPILKVTSETVNSLRGTTEFLGENLVEPVIKLNSYLAGIRKFLHLLGVRK